MSNSLLKKVLYSTWFLAGIPALLIMIALHPMGLKYKMEIETTPVHSREIIYADLNSDSISECIEKGKGNPFSYISVLNLDDRIYDQWNITDSLNPGISEIFFGNYDHDLFREIYIFSYKRDSLFLNVNELLQPSGTRMDRIFITKIGYLNNMVAATVKPAGFYDVNGDGRDELYFSISSHYRLGTRRMYYFDLANRSLKSSQFCGSILLSPEMADANNDKKPEIFGTMSASGNYTTNIPYSDSSTWLMIFDDKLSFEFPPVQFRGFANSLLTLPYRHNKFKGYVLSHRENGTDTTVLKSGIMIYTIDGKLVKYRRYDEFCKSRKYSLFVIRKYPSDRIYLIADKFFELNDSLEVIRTIDLPFDSSVNSYRADVDGDGTEEFLLYSEDAKKLAVYSAAFHKLTEQKFQTPDINWKFSPYYSKDHEYKLFLSSGTSGYFLKLRRNNYYFLGYLAYPGIYVTIFLFILMIKKIGTSQLKAKESLNNRLITLQLQGIKAQLDPHFTFNTLNSIASLIYLEDRQAAYDYMRKFTQLLRSMLNDAELIYRSLGDELAFVTTYLELEKMRFGKKFDYNIEVGEGISQRELVPKLVLQTFAENAVKHGVMPSETGGVIRISVVKDKDYLKLTIKDNGIGREHSAGHSNSTGKGLKLTSEFYEILNQINKRPIKYLITDLYNDLHEPSGTMVEVWVPADDYTHQFRK